MGTVALAKARARPTFASRQVSDGLGQFSERVGKPGCRRYVGPEIVEAPAEVLDEGVPGDNGSWWFGHASVLASVEAAP